MIVPILSNRFQVVIADLSLILFLVCAAALRDDVPALPVAAATAAPAPRETPVMLSVWRDAPGGPSLSQWLSEQPPDDSQRLSIEISYRSGTIQQAFARADALRQSAGVAGENARVLIAEGDRDEALAQLVQDNQNKTGPEIAVQR